MEKYTVRYNRALIPAVVLALAWLPGAGALNVSLFLVAAVSCAWGLAAGLAYIFVFNRIETRRHQKIFLVFSAIALPFIGYGILIGGLLGPLGIIVNSGAPLLILLLFAGGVLYKQEGLRVRAMISTTAFILLVGAGIWLVRSEFAKTRTANCVERLLGTWNEARQRCDVEPAQAIRNGIFFSNVFLDLEGIAISFSDDIVAGRTSHQETGDLMGTVYRAGETFGSARYQADLALDLDGFVVVPVVLEALDNQLYLFSLRPVEGLFGGSTELADAVPLAGIEAAALERNGAVLVVTLAREAGGSQEITVALAEDGGIEEI